MTAHKNRAGYENLSPRAGEIENPEKPKAGKWKHPKKKSIETKRASKALHEKKQELRLQEVSELDFYGE